ncbi:putative transcription factor & lipid binding HD-SAD family [Lupinus albus]|uniref:Putative transcription factor & lipid binding HD-SAD family n=1 Tax=Lupinus albus TaxID=3870 RepID=A0A6A4QVS9_LUPAL|nr:putative transcription factor & lipid binding HD-SAD family [Lupinus albus]
MEGSSDLSLLGENFETGRRRDDDYESRSGSDNFDVASGDDLDVNEETPRNRRRKKYHRHTPSQIQELETFFKECPHPDEKQRNDLSNRLSLSNKQVKFWFQNRRTQMKNQLERHENMMLRQENEKLRAENGLMKEAMANPLCQTCGGTALPGQILFDEHQDQWSEIFPSAIARAVTLEIISTGIPGNKNGAMQVIHVEVQLPSPLVPVRELTFLRYCKQHTESLWAVVDVSVEIGHNPTNAPYPIMNCRRMPSGCIVQDTSNGFSKVTWIEHNQYDETMIHHLYRPLISSGIGFGAQRWIASLQRQYECLSTLLSPPIPTEDPIGISFFIMLSVSMLVFVLDKTRNLNPFNLFLKPFTVTIRLSYQFL